MEDNQSPVDVEVAGLSSACAAPVVVLAHHSFAAEYDAKKPVTLKGTVAKVEWTNPHRLLLYRRR